MKSLTNLIHKTPWWALVVGGFVILAALALFVTPRQLISLEKSGATPEENKAIKREIDYAFTEGAIDFARGVVREMHERAKDPARKEELAHAIEELDNARDGLREAGREVLRAKTEAVESVVEAAKEAREAIAEANKDALRALKDAGVENPRITKALEESLQAAKDAEEEARRALAESKKERAVDKVGRAVDRANAAAHGKSIPTVPPIPAVPEAPSVPKVTVERSADGEKKRVIIGGLGSDKPLIDIQVDGKGGGRGARIQIDPHSPPAAPLAPLPPLSPEVKADIREKVTGDLYRIGIGSGLILIFIPLFILTIVAKIFIDRARASMRLAELKKKEADFHSMSRQVTEAKLQALQAQVEPHFLYNTLASVQALTEVDPARANAMTGHLIQYLRNALPKMRESVSTVGQEIELVRAYLNILQMRMGKRLTFDITVPQSLLELPFPPLMVPSLVENAIKHGLEPQREGGSVVIGAQTQDGKLRLTVADTGRGFGEAIGAGVGLANIRERLAALYGDKARLTLEENAPHGVIATIEVPLGVSANTTMPPPIPESPTAAATNPSFARKTLNVAAGAERVWRKTLSFTFIALVIVAAVFCGLVLFGGMTGALPVHIAGAEVGGAQGALITSVAMVLAFVVLVLAAALVIAVLYGLGFIVVGLAIFIPVVILVGLLPALAPFVLFGLFIWWFVRKKKKKKEDEPVAPKVEPTISPAPAPAAAPAAVSEPAPPPLPTDSGPRL